MIYRIQSRIPEEGHYFSGKDWPIVCHFHGHRGILQKKCLIGIEVFPTNISVDSSQGSRKGFCSYAKQIHIIHQGDFMSLQRIQHSTTILFIQSCMQQKFLPGDGEECILQKKSPPYVHNAMFTMLNTSCFPHFVSSAYTYLGFIIKINKNLASKGSITLIGLDVVRHASSTNTTSASTSSSSIVVMNHQCLSQKVITPWNPVVLCDSHSPTQKIARRSASLQRVLPGMDDAESPV